MIYIAITKPYMSNSLRRIDEVLRETSPYPITDNKKKADFFIGPVVSLADAQNLPLHKSYIWQLCYQTAGGSEQDWQQIWSQALGVISYYDLPTNYLRLPLGYNPKLFVNKYEKRTHDILVTGYIDGPLGEEITSLTKYFDNVIHVGKKYDLPNYTNYINVSDEEMVDLYNKCTYVAGLRHTEGFELPIIEGAACGCIPITFNYECYRHWFENLAVLVNTVADLEWITFMSPPNNIEERVKKFTWETVMRRFWDYVEFSNNNRTR